MSNVFAVEHSTEGGTKAPIRYSCTQLMSDNQAYSLEVEYYYDILHDASMDAATAVAHGEAALLKSVAEYFGLDDGARCSIPPVTSLWMIDVTSTPVDEPVDVFDACLELTPGAGQSCSVYKGFMGGHYLGAGDPSSFQEFIQQNLNNIGGNEGIEIAYLGAQLDTSLVNTDFGRDNLNPSVSKVEAPETADPGKQTVSVVGGLFVAGFLAAFLALFVILFLVMYRRRQKSLSAQDMEIALSKSDLDDMSPSRDRDGSRKDRDINNNMKPENMEPEIGEEDGDDDDYPNYRFDLATSMKNELFNIHGRAVDAPKSYGIGIEETSDSEEQNSDADSWAQTDGTIGSLELQLEPITAEV